MKPQLSPQSIMTVVARDSGMELAGYEPVSEGEDSQAFAVRMGDEACIIRVNRSAKGFHKDAYCYRRFGSAELPIPEIIRIGRLDEESCYCISRRAPGRTLQDLQASELPFATMSVMRIMEALGSVSVAGTSGFGPFDEYGKGRFASWRDYIASILDPSDYDWDSVLLPISGHHQRRIAAALEEIEAFVPHCPEVRQLVHGDFGSNNVLTNDGAITGVIDWSEAMFGDPLYDVANMFFWRSWLECMEVQARYIEEQHPEITERAEALRCYQLRIGLEVIFHSAADDETEVFEWAAARCEEIVTSQ